MLHGLALACVLSLVVGQELLLNPRMESTHHWHCWGFTCEPPDGEHPPLALLGLHVRTPGWRAPTTGTAGASRANPRMESTHHWHCWGFTCEPPDGEHPPLALLGVHVRTPGWRAPTTGTAGASRANPRMESTHHWHCWGFTCEPPDGEHPPLALMGVHVRGDEGTPWWSSCY